MTEDAQVTHAENGGQCLLNLGLLNLGLLNLAARIYHQLTLLYSLLYSGNTDPYTISLSLALWRDISVIWLALLCFIGLVVPLALAYLAVRGMDAALRHAGHGLHKAQTLTGKARVQTTTISEKVTAPVISINRRVARWQRVARALGLAGSAKSTTHQSRKG